MYNGFEVQDEMLNSKIYDGTTLKFGIRVAEEDFIVKKNTNAFLYSEYVGSRFIAGLGLPVQEVWLGYYKNDLVFISKDFSVKGFSQFQSFKDIRQSKELDLSSKFYTFDDIFRLVDYHTKISSENKEKIKLQFWKMFLCDAILGNRDRHHGNWGFLWTKDGYIPAPIYDTENALFSDVDFFNIKDKHYFIDNPTSLFRNKVSKIKYTSVFNNLKSYPLLLQEVRQIRENFGYLGIRSNIVNVVDEVSKIIPKRYGDFYVAVVCMRYLRLIERYSVEDAVNIVKGGLQYGM